MRVTDLEEVKRHYGYTMGLMPTQHGITRGETIYFFDPAGNLNDRFTTVMT